ncbi:DUF4214 domain-containing protein [Aliarcobacter cryaerophilus]|uniref:DUF4214 domain-containing protein n=1 Tax=Aliarcobacter cryaerophilus TaxID=28198 RepID=A0A7G9LPE5_9BACT|nr:DUF4214 domain-containing protein [Aliarcobacter cryaerophilus]QNM90494.1 DUF4214 domain-containing protein [Aliarcobacter cryaerophilus]
MALTQKQVSELYVAIFNRASEGEGNKFWQQSVDTKSAANDMLETDAAKAYFGDSLDSNKAFIEHIYLNTLSKTPEDDAAGIAFWTAALDSGMSRGEVVAGLIEAIESNKNSKDTKTKAAYEQFINRVEVSNYMANTVEKAPEGYETSTVFTTSGTTGLVVTNDASTVTTAKNSVKALTIDGETFTLTTSVDTINGSDANDLIIGTTSSLSSEKTLTSADMIDGGAGIDTLQVSMKAAFTGFTGDGKMENVEIVELTNDSTIERNFDASGITGVEKYVIDATKADVTLTDLNAAGIEITYSGAKAKKINVAFDSAFVAANGTADEMTFNVDGLGAAAVAATSTTAAVPEVAVTSTMAGIESLTVNATGDASFLNLAGVTSAKTLTVTGDADLKIADVAGTVTVLDATASTGNTTAVLSNSGALTNVATGSGDDSITINTAKILANAEVAGGAGEDTLVVTGGTKTLQLSMSGVETVATGSAMTGDVTMSNVNTSDITTINVGSVAAADKAVAKLTMVSLGGSDITVNSNGTQDLATEALNIDNSGSTTINLNALDANVTNKVLTQNDLYITATKATEVIVNVNEYVKSNSVITALEAASLTLNTVSGKTAGTTPSEVTDFKGTIHAEKATSIIVNSAGILAATINAEKAASAEITTAKGTNTLDLAADVLETLTVTAAGDLDMNAASTLTSVQIVEASTAGHLKLNALSKASSVTIGGTAAASQATLTTIGSNTLDYSTTVNASGLAGGLTLASIIAGAGANVTLNVGEVTGITTVTGALTAGSTVTVNADGAADAIELRGTITGDKVIINATDALSTVTAATAGAVAITANSSVTYNGTNLAANKADITAKAGSTALTATLNGGIEADTHTITLDSTSTSLTVTGDLGLGTNGLTVTAVDTAGASVASVVNISGLSNLTTSTIDLSADTTTPNTYTVTGSAGKDTITGAGAADTITGGKGADTLTGGTGADTFVFAAGDSGLTTATADKIADFITNSDKLKLGTAGTATNFFDLDSTGADDATTAVATANAATGAGTSFDGTVQYIFVNDETGGVDTNGFLVIDSNLDGTADMVIELTGLAATADFAFGDIIA